MGQHLIDEHTADRLLSGALAPEDAPPGLADVARFLQAARTPPMPQELARCAETVAAMAEVVVPAAPAPSAKTTQRAGLSRLLRPRMAATLTAGALVLLWGGLAEAGVLPGPLQHAAHVVLSEVGISVPDAGTGGLAVATGRSGSLLPSGAPGALDRPQNGTVPARSRGHGRGPSQGRGHGRSGPVGRSAGGSRSPRRGAVGTHSVRRSASPASGSDSIGPKGLCTAWSRGRGGDRGEKLSATAFRRLKAMAEAHEEPIAAFCDQVGHGPGSSPQDRTHGGTGSSDSEDQRRTR